jgi:hypothetical protein
MEIRNRSARAIITGLVVAVIAMLGVALIRVFLFVLDNPGWWVLVLGVALGSGGAQWIIDRPRPADE